MTRSEFLDKLKTGLAGLPDEDITRGVEFYGEMIDDRMEDGLSEDEAVAAIGSVDEAISQILSEIPLSKLVKEKVTPKRSLGALEIVLLVLGSPIWLSLLAAAAVIVLSVYVVFWSVIISLWAAVISVASVSLLGIGLLPMYLLQGNIPAGLFMGGSGLLLVGLSIFMFYGCSYATKGLLWLSKRIFLLIKFRFVRKGTAK
jgi:uncharacterized membrane protein